MPSLMNKYGHSTSQNCHAKCLSQSFHRDWTEKETKELPTLVEDNKSKKQSINLSDKYTFFGEKVKDHKNPIREHAFDNDLNYPLSVHKECQNSSFLFGKDPKSNAYDHKIIISSYKQPGLYPQNELITTDTQMTCKPSSFYTQPSSWNQKTTYSLDESNKYIGPYRGYATQKNINPMYKTTAQDYGSKTPCVYHMTKVLHHIDQNLSRTLIGRRQDGLTFNHGFTCRKNICAIIKKR